MVISARTLLRDDDIWHCSFSLAPWPAMAFPQIHNQEPRRREGTLGFNGGRGLLLRSINPKHRASLRWKTTDRVLPKKHEVLVSRVPILSTETHTGAQIMLLSPISLGSRKATIFYRCPRSMCFEQRRPPSASSASIRANLLNRHHMRSQRFHPRPKVIVSCRVPARTNDAKSERRIDK